MRRLGRAVLLLSLLAAQSCFLPFWPGRTYQVTGTFTAGHDYTLAPSEANGQCQAVVGSDTSRSVRSATTWAWTSSFLGRGDLDALQILCSFGTGYDDGQLTLTFPNVGSTAPIDTGTYSVIELESGGWGTREKPRVAWSVMDVPSVRGSFLASRSGVVVITYSDGKLVKGRFDFTARTERRS